MRKLVFVVISLLFICGCGVDIQKADKVTKEDIISFEYSIPDDNPFDYLEKEELENFLDKSTGILIISNPDYEFSAYFIKQFNYLLEDYDINEVYYYDFSKLKELSVSIKDKLEIILPDPDTGIPYPELQHYSIRIVCFRKGCR